MANQLVSDMERSRHLSSDDQTVVVKARGRTGREDWTKERYDLWRSRISESNKRASRPKDEADDILARIRESTQRTSANPVLIYGLVDPLNSSLRYVGKTVAALAKRYSQHEVDARRGKEVRLYRWWRSITSAGRAPEAFVIEIVPPGEDWVDAEQFWIAYFRSVGADLVNCCLGGQGTDGIRFTKEHRKRLSEARKGRAPSSASNEKRAKSMQEAWRTKPRPPMSETTRAKISEASRCRRASPETIARMGESQKARYQRFRDAGMPMPNAGGKWTEEQKAKLPPRKGVPLSAAHRAAISAGKRKAKNNDI